MSERMTARIAGWMGEAFAAHDLGEEILWDVTMAMTPDQGPVVLMVATMKGGLLDTVLHNVTVLATPIAATREGVDRMVVAMLNGLREERSKQLAQGNGSGSAVTGIPLHGPYPPA